MVFEVRIIYLALDKPKMFTITWCPPKLFPLLFDFLGFLGVYKFHLGHFQTALFSVDFKNILSIIVCWNLDWNIHGSVFKTNLWMSGLKWDRPQPWIFGEIRQKPWYNLMETIEKIAPWFLFIFFKNEKALMFGVSLIWNLTSKGLFWKIRFQSIRTR